MTVYNLNINNDALFLDIDGTLLDIADTPQKVTISPTLIRNLEKLHDKLDGALALASGRTLEDIDQLFSPLHLPAVGVHGAEWRFWKKANPHFLHGLPESLPADVYAKLPQHPGILIEKKKYAMAVHYRLAPSYEKELETILSQVLSSYKDLALMRGKMVFEIVQMEINKGAAIERFMKYKPFAGRRPIFLGDDKTDLYAIDACQRLGGIGGQVGPDMPPQDIFFANPAAVRSWLDDQAT